MELWVDVARLRIGRAVVVLSFVIDLFADRQSSDTNGGFDIEAMFAVGVEFVPFSATIQLPSLSAGIRRS